MQKGMMKRKMSENETPHFFKVFLQDDVLSPTLVIPRKFARKHGRRLSGSVRLKIPRGDIWQVKLEKKKKKDGEICLRDGWADFVKHYGISHGYFLVFRYEGRSMFHVIIFNVTACEIDYPVKPDPGRKSCPADKLPLTPKKEDDDSGTDQEVGPRGKKRKKEQPLHSPRPPNIIRIRGTRSANAGIASCSSPRKELPCGEENPNRVKRKRGMFYGHLNSDCLKIHSQSAKVARKSGALAKASSYQCERPSFMVIVGSTSIHPRHFLYVPTKFLKLGVLKQGETGYITLWVPGRKTWMVKYHYAGRCTISCGWRVFVSENELRAGDVLVFELIRITRVKFRVVIFRDEGASRTFSADRRKKLFDETVGNKSAREKCSPRRRADSKFLEEDPSFETVLSRRDTAACSLYVPARFARTLSRGSRTKNNEAMLKVGRRSWPIELKIHASGSTALRLASGWTQFMRENDLHTGDTCLFKLVDEEQLVIEVSIRRKRAIGMTTTARDAMSCLLKSL